MELEFFNACSSGNLTLVEKLIKQNVYLGNWQNPNYCMYTPFMAAC